MTIVIKDRPGPYQVVFMIVALLGGIGVIALKLLHLPSGSLSQLNPSWMTFLLAGGLIVGAAITLAGVAMQTLSGPLLERTGQGLLAGMLVAYALFILDVSGTKGLITAIFFVGFAAAAIWRIFQVNRVVRITRQTVLAKIEEEGRPNG